MATFVVLVSNVYNQSTTSPLMSYTLERDVNVQEDVLRMEDNLATAQTQVRLALARAVKAEQEADRVPALEQQLSETKANLEQQIHMKDEERVAVQQQFDKTKVELRQTVCQLEEKVASAQRKARLALARAVRAEQEADQVPVLERQLSQTKANLEEETRVKDEARIAAQQQFDQTRTALEHQILARDQTNAAIQRSYYQMKAALEHQIEVKEQARLLIQQQFHQMKSTLEHQLQEREPARMALERELQEKEQARVDLEHQLLEKKQARVTLEHQLQEKEQARLALETEIQAKDHEKGELEQQLHRKDEHIRTLQREQMSAVVQSQDRATQVPDLSEDLSQVDSQADASVVPYAPTIAVEVAEVQKVSRDGQVIAQEEVVSAHQLLPTGKEVGEREQEFRQGTELAAKLQLELESKNLEVVFLRCDGQEKDDEIATIKRHRTEESKALQSQVDSLQQGLENLQQTIIEKDIIISDSQSKQDRIEMLELEKQEQISKIDSLEARCREVEFFRDTYSWEVDQLRDDVMDKEVEIDFLRKQQVHMMPTPTSPSSDPVGKL